MKNRWCGSRASASAARRRATAWSHTGRRRPRPRSRYPDPSDVPVAAQLARRDLVNHAEVWPLGSTSTQHAAVARGTSDPATPNRVAWRLFRSVLTVNQGDHAGDGVAIRDLHAAPRCHSHGHDVAAAPSSSTSTTWRVAERPGSRHHRDHPQRTAARAGGRHPHRRARCVRATHRHWWISPSASIRSPSRSVAENAAPDPLQTCPCDESDGGSLRIRRRRTCTWKAWALERRLAMEGSSAAATRISSRLDPGSQNSAVIDCLLDGGARAITLPSGTQGETGPSTGKDMRAPTRTTPGRPPRAERGREQRLPLLLRPVGVKSKQGYFRLERNWIITTCARVFARSPTDASNEAGSRMR